MKILVVDDTESDRTLISKMLMEHGYEALEARNGFEAQEILKNILPDLILSNISMPGLDGFTLLLRLKKNTRTNIIPFVFYTGTYVSDEDRELGLSLGASRYILKSLEPNEFVYEIEKLIKEFKEGEIKPRKPIISEEEYLEKYSDRISQKLESEIDKIDREIEKRKIAQKELQDAITQRHIAEEKVRSASLYARSLIEASLDALVTINRDGKITDVNKATEEVTGIARNQLIGTDFSHYFTEPEKAHEGYEEVFSKGFVRDFPLAIRHTSGSTTDVLYNATVYKNERGEVEGVFAAARDITQRKKAEEKVRSASLYARSLIEASLDALVTINRDGKITDVNIATEEVTGVARDQLIGTDFSDYFTEPEKAHEGYEEVFSKGFVRDYPLAIRHISGSTTDVLYNATVYKNEQGEVEGVFAAARDITERKYAEELVKLEDRRLQSLLKISMYKPETMSTLLNMALDEVVSLSESKVGYIYFYSEEKEEFTLHAWSKNVMESCNIQNPQTTYQLQRTGIWGEAVRQRKPIIVNDFKAPNPMKKGYPQGHTPLVRFMTLPIFSNECIVAVVGVGNKETDYNDIDVIQLKQMIDSVWLIAQRQEAQEAMRLAKEEAERASRIKSEFLEKMSHELRTPLNAIIGFNELLKMKTIGELNQKQEHYVSNISNSGKHLLGIINDMLDLVKVESGENLPLDIEYFNANEGIDETLIFVQEKAVQKNIIIKKEIDPLLNIISADKIRFKQILLNILNNAIKFSKPQGGTVTIAAHKVEDMAQFSVSDTGIGIREEEMGKLFSLFYQADSGISRKYAGTGVGLAIIKQLVEQHGGKLWAESKYGEGSTFTFTIPLMKNTEGTK